MRQGGVAEGVNQRLCDRVRVGIVARIVGPTFTGDAEHGRAHIAPEHMGSIDAKPVRELVEEILEGGKEAFERRRRKYGF